MTQFAARLCKTPVSFITLYDQNFELLKVQSDLKKQLTPADLSFCRYALPGNDVLVVNDTLVDNRFRGQSSTIGGHKVRFYAAAPMVTRAKLPVGMLCVMDYKPHVLSMQERITFGLLAKHIINLMELKMSVNLLNQNFRELQRERKSHIDNELKLRSMFESLTDCYFLLRLNGEVLDFNRAAYEAVLAKCGIKLSYGLILADVMDADYRETFVCNMKVALNGKKKHFERLAKNKANERVWWGCTIEPIKNANGELMGVSFVARNINEQKLNEEKIVAQNQKLTRIAEIQSHDYRGPVASILGLMNLIEAEDYVAPKEYLLLLQQAVKDLDEKIHEVVDVVSKI